MGDFTAIRTRGQTLILIALLVVALIAFVALAVDGANAYAARREAQSAADGAAIAGTWVMVEYAGGSPVADILRKVNTYAESNGVADTNGIPGDPVNNNVLAYYVDADGNRLLDDQGNEWELHTGPLLLPSSAHGIEAVTTITRSTFFARVIGVNQVQAMATATAKYEIDGGILPIAVNEYWYGSQGHLENCPYEHCGPPYSFVRDPSQPPPFRTTDGGLTWERNSCPDPYNDNTCQGPYEGYGENFGQAFSLMGQDAYPNDPSRQPRSGVVIDVRYDALVDDGQWYTLVADNQFLPSAPLPQGQGQHAAEEIFMQGGYRRVPLPRALHEPPPEFYVEDWGYCWANPPSEDHCFNYPKEDRSEPYDVLQFLYGSESGHLAHSMYDDGNYVDGRYAPGERIVIMVYNGAPGENWGSRGKQNDTAVVVGYFGAIIVGYGNEFETPDPGPGCTQCRCNGTPGDWQSYTHCIRSQGQPTGVYGIAAPNAPLTLDPTRLLQEFLPKKIVLIR